MRDLARRDELGALPDFTVMPLYVCMCSSYDCDAAPWLLFNAGLAYKLLSGGQKHSRILFALVRSGPGTLVPGPGKDGGV